MRVLITADLATARRQLQAITQSAGHTVLDSADLGAGALLASAEWVLTVFGDADHGVLCRR